MDEQNIYYVYVLVSEIKGLRFYIGLTEDIERRLKEHNSGKNKSTKYYVPWKMFFFEEKKGRKAAREREKFLKSGSSKERIKEKWFRSSAG